MKCIQTFSINVPSPKWGLWLMSWSHQFTIYFNVYLLEARVRSQGMWQVLLQPGSLSLATSSSTKLCASFLGHIFLKLIFTSEATLVWVILWTHRIKKEDNPLCIWLVLFFLMKLHCIPGLTPDHCQHFPFWLRVSKGHCWFPVRGHTLHQGTLAYVFSLNAHTLRKRQTGSHRSLRPGGEELERKSRFPLSSKPMFCCPLCLGLVFRRNPERSSCSVNQYTQYQGNGQDVEYISFFTSLISKNSS